MTAFLTASKQYDLCFSFFINTFLSILSAGDTVDVGAREVEMAVDGQKKMTYMLLFGVFIILHLVMHVPVLKKGKECVILLSPVCKSPQGTQTNLDGSSIEHSIPIVGDESEKTFIGLLRVRCGILDNILLSDSDISLETRDSDCVALYWDSSSLLLHETFSLVLKIVRPPKDSSFHRVSLVMDLSLDCVSWSAIGVFLGPPFRILH
jgi:hypothetical protein